jgi:uncharacterized protein (TIGR03067 family)
MAMPSTEAFKEEMQKFAGLWKIVYYVRDGQALDVSQLTEMIEADGKFTVFSAGAVVSRGHHNDFNLRTDPKRFTNVYTEDKTRAGQKTLAIYRLDGDIMEACHGPANQGWPTEFTSPEGSGRSHLILKRIPQDLLEVID